MKACTSSDVHSESIGYTLYMHSDVTFKLKMKHKVIDLVII